MTSILRAIRCKTWVSGGRTLWRQSYPGCRSLASTAGDDEASWKYDHDVVVVGGGIVGCSLACRLAEDVSGGAGSVHSGGTEGRGDARPSIALIEAAPPKPLEAVLSRDGFDPRVYALTPSSVGVLERIGVWDSFGGQLGDADSEAGRGSGTHGGVKGRSQSFGSMQVWDDRGPGYVRFSGKAGKVKRKKAMGFISEHGVLHSALFERVRELHDSGHVELTCPAQVKRVGFPREGAGGTRGPMTVTLETKDGETRDVACRLLVAADGGQSKVRLAGSHDGIAFQRYLSRGPLAMLPLTNDHASLVWSTAPDHAEHLKALGPERFLAEVNNALRLPFEAGTGSASGPPASAGAGAAKTSFLPPEFHGLGAGLPKFPLKGLAGAMNPVAAAHAVAGGVIDGIEGVSGALAGLSGGLSGVGVQEFSVPPEAVEVVGPRLGFDLSLRQAHSYKGPRAALVGDAAHTIHPMAGQGLNLGLADADALARIVLDGRRSGTDLGSEALLSLYEKERKMDALVMMGTLDFLHRLFGAEGRGVAAVRNAGLSAFNLSGPIKERIMLHAMGGRGA